MKKRAKKRVVEIVISRGLVPSPTRCKAELKGGTGFCGYGANSHEAVGEFIRLHGQKLGIELVYEHQETKPF